MCVCVCFGVLNLCFISILGAAFGSLDCRGRETNTMIEPSTFDAIVVGTGLPEAMLAASIAAAGKTVLHLDAYEGYLSPWASLSFSTFKSFASSGGFLPKPSFSPEEELTFPPEEIEYTILQAKDAPALYSHVKVSSAHDESALGRLNRYSLDLAGKDVTLAFGFVIELWFCIQFRKLLL